MKKNENSSYGVTKLSLYEANFIQFLSLFIQFLSVRLKILYNFYHFLYNFYQLRSLNGVTKASKNPKA